MNTQPQDHQGQQTLAQQVRIQDIQKRVIAVVAEQLGTSRTKVEPKHSFIADLGADSLDTVELIMALEDEFRCEIPDESAERINTVQEAIDWVNSNVQNLGSSFYRDL